jgi:hypothetical protein
MLHSSFRIRETRSKPWSGRKRGRMPRGLDLAAQAVEEGLLHPVLPGEGRGVGARGFSEGPEGGVNPSGGDLGVWGLHTLQTPYLFLLVKPL